LSKQRRAFSPRSLEIRSADLNGDHGVVPLSGPHPDEEATYLLTLAISMAGQGGADLFYTRISTPAALAARTPEAPTVMSSRAAMIVSAFHWPTVEQHLEKLMKSCAAPTWAESVERLLRYFSWEYEDSHHPSRDHVVVPSKKLKIRSTELAGELGPISPREQRPNEEIYDLLTLAIGMAGEEPTERFCTRIATPEALAARAPRTPTMMFSRGIVVVSAFHWRTIDERLREIVKGCEAPTWSDARSRLRRTFSEEHEAS